MPRSAGRVAIVIQDCSAFSQWSNGAQRQLANCTNWAPIASVGALPTAKHFRVLPDTIKPALTIDNDVSISRAQCRIGSPAEPPGQEMRSW